MMKKLFLFIFVVLFSLSSIGCDSDAPEVEVGFSPAIVIPIRVAISNHGNLSVELNKEWTTPIGTFDIETSADVYSLRRRYDNNVLIVRVDEDAFVYELESGKDFRVNFDDDNTLYKRVALEYESNGDIILELESVQKTTSNNSGSGQSTGSNTSSKDYVRISCGEGITQAALRRSPGYSSKDDSVDIIYKIDCDQRLELLGSSQRADGLTWWHVEWNGYTGWMADHTGSGRTILIFE